MTRSNNRSTLEGFSNKDIADSTGNKSKPISVNEAKIRKLENEMESLRHRMDAMNVKLSNPKNGRQRNKRVVYIGDKIYPTCKKFQDSPSEPLKETIKKIFAAAEKYLELTGVQNNMSLFNHQKTLQESLES